MQQVKRVNYIKRERERKRERRGSIPDYACRERKTIKLKRERKKESKPKDHDVFIIIHYHAVNVVIKNRICVVP